MAQAYLVAEAMRSAHGVVASIHAVETVGDKVLDRPLAEIGGKALWTKELDGALLNREIDFAVHSMKDVETLLAPGIALVSVLPRADPRDRLVGAPSLAAIPAGGVVGTSSPRRAAQLLHRRPDLSVISLRGNVGTRMRHIAEGRADATFLAAAGLDRLGVEAGAPLELDQWIPAAAQGIIGITCRADDSALIELLSAISHAPSMNALLTERGVLEGLGGSCHTAVAVNARLVGDAIRVAAELFSADGREMVAAEVTGTGDPRELGRSLAAELMAKATPSILVTLEQANSPGAGH